MIFGDPIGQILTLLGLPWPLIWVEQLRQDGSLQPCIIAESLVETENAILGGKPAMRNFSGFRWMAGPALIGVLDLKSLKTRFRHD